MKDTAELQAVPVLLGELWKLLEGTREAFGKTVRFGGRWPWC